MYERSQRIWTSLKQAREKSEDGWGWGWVDGWVGGVGKGDEGKLPG